MITPAELIELKQKQEQISLAIAKAEKDLLISMLEDGTEQLKAGGGSITLQYRASKAREKSETELAIAQAIVEEQQEMASNNAAKIYALQRQAYLATMEAEALLQTPWSIQLKQKLMEAELARKAQKQSKPFLSFELPQPSPEDLCTAEQYNSYLAKAANCLPKRMTKLCLLNFLKANKHLQGDELDKAFEERLQEHSSYWSSH